MRAQASRLARLAVRVRGRACYRRFRALYAIRAVPTVCSCQFYAYRVTVRIRILRIRTRTVRVHTHTLQLLFYYYYYKHFVEYCDRSYAFLFIDYRFDRLNILSSSRGVGTYLKYISKRPGGKKKRRVQ